jgi:phosphoribosylglycinamide formyltransferase 1
MLHVAILGSGRGSNFQAILNAVGDGSLPNAAIQVAVSNNSNAGILEIARLNAIPAVHLSERMFPDEGTFIDTLLGTFRQHDVDFIVLAGYMKRLHPRVIAAFRNRVINIHPALLPKHGGKGMYGMNVHNAVVALGEQVSGATVHIVDEEFDHGAIVLQKSVSLEPTDTPETVAAKVLVVEHEILPQALRLFAEGRVTVTDKTVTIH